MKPRRTAPRKKARLVRHIEATLSRARRREATELAERYARRAVYPAPEDDTGRYVP